MSLFRNTYRNESARLPSRDYRLPGMYFVTICTKNRRHSFGCIRDGVMQLSEIGRIVAGEWKRTPIVRPNVYIDEWVIMPDHMHGIIIIRDPTLTDAQWADVSPVPEKSGSIVGVLSTFDDGKHHPVGTPRRGVPTPDIQTNNIPIQYDEFSSWKPGCLGAIINQFKSICTKRIRRAGYDGFAWQARFYDHVIRDERALYRIRQYIRDNPKKWNDHTHDDAMPIW